MEEAKKEDDKENEKETIYVTEFIHSMPEYRHRFENLEWITKIVGHVYDYDDTVYWDKLHLFYGVFIGLFIRKCLCTRFKMDCSDYWTKTVLSTQIIEIPGLRNKITCAYTRYTDDSEKAIKIVNDIKVVALSHRLFFNERVENVNNVRNMKVNYANLKEIVKFINGLPYDSVMWQEKCKFEFDTIQVEGLVDLVFDNKVFCQISTSKYEDSYKKKATQLVFYILGHYEKNYYELREDRSYELMVYNPLLNEVYKTRFEMNPSVYEELHSQIEIDAKKFLGEDILIDSNSNNSNSIEKTETISILPNTEKLEDKNKKVEAVTTFIKLHPKYRQRFENLEWTTQTVGNAYDYDSTVYLGELHPFYGVFMILFIRKCVCTRFGMDFVDNLTEEVLSEEIKTQGLRHKLICAHERYKKVTTKAIDIVNDIKVLALSHSMFYRGKFQNLNTTLNMRVNYENLKEIVEFVNRLPYGSVCRDQCDIEFDKMLLSGCVDLIFDSKVFCQTSTSKKEESYKNKMAQLVFYIVSHYGRNYYESREDHTYELMVYNPLLSKVHTTCFEMSASVYEELRSEIEVDANKLVDEEENEQ